MFTSPITRFLLSIPRSICLSSHSLYPCIFLSISQSFFPSLLHLPIISIFHSYLALSPIHLSVFFFFFSITLLFLSSFYSHQQLPPLKTTVFLPRPFLMPVVSSPDTLISLYLCYVFRRFSISSR